MLVSMSVYSSNNIASKFRPFHPLQYLESYFEIETYKYLGKIYFAFFTTVEFIFKRNNVLALDIFNAIFNEILFISEYALSYSTYMYI